MSEQIPDGYELRKKKSWFARHKILSVVGAILLIVALANLGGGGTDAPTDAGTAQAPDVAEPAAPAAPKAAAPKPAAAKPAPKPAIVVSAKEMIAVLEGNALKAKNTYEDKRVTVSGFVGSIDSSGGYFALDPQKNAIIFTGIRVDISDKFRDQVANFNKGQAVTVTGKITDVGEIAGYSLKAETIK